MLGWEASIAEFALTARDFFFSWIWERAVLDAVLLDPASLLVGLG